MLYQTPSSKLWYQHIFVYKRWRQTCTSVYRCVADRRQYGGTPRTPKQRQTCPPVGGSHNWLFSESDKSKDFSWSWRWHFLWTLLEDLLGDKRPRTLAGFPFASSRISVSSFACVYVSITGPPIPLVLSCLLFNIPPPASLPSISLQQITACLRPPGCSPQLFWLRLQIYLYYTMQRAGTSDGGLPVQWVYVPQSDCLSSRLVSFNRCQTESGRASVRLFH